MIISKIYLIPNKSLRSVTYAVELFSFQTNPNISRLKCDTRKLLRPIFITSNVLSNRRVFFKPNFSFHIYPLRKRDNTEGKTGFLLMFYAHRINGFFVRVVYYRFVSILQRAEFKKENGEYLYLMWFLSGWSYG